MSDPQVALFILGIFIFIILLGFPIAFTLMAMGVGFGYYAYFDAPRMWRTFNRAVESSAETARLSHPALDHADLLRRGIGRIDRATLRRRPPARVPARRSLPRLRD